MMGTAPKKAESKGQQFTTYNFRHMFIAESHAKGLQTK